MRFKLLDNLKGIFITAIVLFHMGLFSGGFIAVDGFLILSGYFLMTTLDKNYYKGFRYLLRRTFKNIFTRILPVIGIMVIFGLVYYRIIKPLNFDTVNKQGIYALFGMNNWYSVLKGIDYWGSTDSIFTHLWYSSVLIQLNIVMTFIGYVILKLNERRKNLGNYTLIVITIICALYSFVLAREFTFNRAYYGTDVRLIAFVIGMLIPLLLRNKLKLYKRTLGIVTITALIGLLITYVTIDINRFSVPTMLMLSLTLNTLLIIGSVTLVNKKSVYCEKSNIFVTLGRYSLYIYIWHWVPIVMFKDNFLFTTKGVILLLITLVLIIGCTKLSLIINKNNTLKLVTVYSIVFILHCFIIPIEIQKVKTNPIITNRGCTTKLLIVGDSWGRYMGAGFAGIAERENITVYNRGYGGFGIMKPDYYVGWDGTNVKPKAYYYNYLEDWEHIIKKFKPTDLILFVGNYDQSKQVIDGKELQVGDKHFDSIYVERLKAIVDLGIKYNLNIVLTCPADNATTSNDSVSEQSLNEVSDAMRKNILNVAQEYGNKITIFDIDNILSPNSRKTLEIYNNYKVFDESGHPNQEVCEYIANNILSLIRN